MGDLHIHLKLKKQHLIVFISLIAIFGIVLVTNAYGSNQPDVMGHSAGELSVDFGGSHDSIQNVFNSLDSDRDGIIDNANSVHWDNLDDKPDVATETWASNNFYDTSEAYNKSQVRSLLTECSWDGRGPLIAGERIDSRDCYGCCYSMEYCSGNCKEIRTRSYYLVCENGRVTEIETVDSSWSGCICDGGSCYEYDYDGDYSSPTCLVAGTSVLMADNNFKNVEYIQKGDYVINEKGEKDKVIGLWQPKIGDRNTYIINNNIEVTPDHPFMTTEGWKVIDIDMLKSIQKNTDFYQDIKATELKVGDVLITKDGKEVVETIEENSERPSEEIVYTLVLENGEGFYANDYLVADDE